MSRRVGEKKGDDNIVFGREGMERRKFRGGKGEGKSQGRAARTLLLAAKGGKKKGKGCCCTNPFSQTRQKEKKMR